MNAISGEQGTLRPVTTHAWLQAVLIAVATALTTSLYGDFFAGWGYLPRLIAVAVVAAAMATLVAAMQLGAFGTVLAFAAGFAVTVVPAVLSSTLHDGLPTGLTARAGWHALTGGWASMLTIADPAPSSPQMLMTPALITWVAACLAVTLALRSHAVLGPAAVLVCAQAAGLMFASNQPVSHLLQTCALLVLLLILTLMRAGRPPSRWRVSMARAAGSRVALMAAVIAVGLLVAIISVPVDAAQRFNPRPLLTAPLRLDPAPSPLSEVRQQVRLSVPRTLFTVTITDPAGQVALIQTVALDSFDGSQWSSSGSFLVAGPVLPPGPAISHAVALTEHVTLSTLARPYLPVAGQPVQIDANLTSGALIGFDPSSGTLVADSSSLAGVSYTVIARRQPADASLAEAAAGSGSAVARYVQLPAVPSALSTLAAAITAGERTPYAKLRAIDEYLLQRPISRNAPAGDSYGTLVRLLTATTPQAEAGYADQHASAFAVLARVEHIPVRVVVGYRLPSPSSARHGGASRTYTVTTADAYAWDQAYFPGHGWIDFDPTNIDHTISVPSVMHAPTPPAPSRVASPGTATPSAAPPRPPGPSPTPAATTPTQADPGLGAWGIPAEIVIPVLIAAACVLGVSVTAARRLRRRMRRRRGSTAQRVVGAWEEAVDRLADVGVAIDRSRTALELATRATTLAKFQQLSTRPTREQRALVLAEPVLGELAARATEAAFSRTPPDEEAAKHAWELEGKLRRSLYRGWRAPYRVTYWAIPTPRRAARRQ